MTDAGNIYLLPDPKKSEAEAAEWAARLEGGEMTPADHAAFARWRGESEQNHDAFERFAGLWDGLDRLEDLNAYDAVDNAPVQRPFLRRAAVALPALAAVLLAVLAIGALIKPDVLETRSPHFAANYQTKVGGQEIVSLPDGSKLTLNTNSRIATEFTKTERRVRLLRGEAFFEVAHDTSRPFSVYAGSGVVRAVGTAFSVRLNKANKLDVMVSEGRVALATAKPLAGTPSVSRPTRTVMELTAGQSAVFSAEHVEILEHVTPTEIDRKLSWRVGMLAFAGEPLSDVVDEVGRYSDVDIEVRGDELRAMPIAGYFKAGEVEGFVEALHIMTGVEVTEVAPGHLVLSASK
ncbi:FecR family protein [Sphingosinicella microcystinivorans]|uniref:FecR family protein n=1 Tax=Sphingosinicella microcystinivorans TaxID=335406 RepID=A0AAD1D559_SPHMI|nr:FecR domain-containing protein [Sphingosinicella microcystinivorans]RKS91076.1 FecR family protein [Sphingosinicella microcystinivorans]BBE33997.1 iron dicitrate transporter FecR [Sphingosinicella microcystinivorans]